MAHTNPQFNKGSRPDNGSIESGENHFPSLITQHIDGIVVIGGDGRIRFINPAAEALFGKSWVDVIGEPFEFPLTNGNRTEIALLQQDGNFISVEMRIAEVDWGNERAYLASLRDITHRKEEEEERKRAEIQMLHVQKLESLGILAGGIAHDFNNLLMTIVAHAGLAAQKMSRESPGRDHLLKIEQAALRGGELANQMLAYAGKGKPIIQSINLSKLVEEMGHLLAVSISKRAVLTYDLLKKIPLIPADPSQIRQIVMNLIINASEAIGDRSGTITLRTGKTFVKQSYLRQCEFIGELNDGDCVFLEIQDSGSGLAPESLKKMFDPFFTTKFAGRGLGLAALLGIVRAHGGAINVSSIEGEGTKFRILLPCIHSEESSSSPENNPKDNWRGSGTILVIDDEEDVRLAAQLILEEIGFTVLCAKDGRKGLEVFQEHHPHIRGVLLDLTMPHMSGEHVYSAMRNISPNIPIILSSGYSEEEALKRFSKTGIQAFIQKPYPVESLTKKIQEIVEPKS
jgi:signal transduction histidine kinase/ActR/RegA family two-component response regulator